MKKLYFLFLLLTPFFVNAQTWDFTASKDGWTNIAATQSTKADYWELTSKVGVVNPGLKITPPVPAIDVSINSILAITMKNKSTTGPDIIRAAAVTSGDTGSGNIYISIDISKGDTEYQTYYIDFGTPKWVGTVDEIKLLFKATGNSDYTGTGNEVFDIDKIELLASLPTSEKNIYNFDTDDDTEGFFAVNGSISGPTSGLLTFVPVATKYAKLDQQLHHVDATANKFAHITLKNNSSLNNQLRLISPGLAGTLTQIISVSDTTEDTYVFDLTGEAGWTGDQVFTIGIGTDTDGKAADASTIELNAIIFNNSSTLGIDDVDLKDDVSISLYPNPVQHVLNVKASSNINKIEVYNILGQHVLSIKNSNSIDVQHLNKGAYITKIFQDNDIVSTKRFFKD